MKKTKDSKVNRKVVAIIGPTGSGKSAWAKFLAQKFAGKVISVDSRQIYKGMDIGTAKDKSFHQDLIDIAEPADNFSLSDYQKAATALINQYLQKKNVPILVGGTGLYLDSVIYGYVIPDLKKESMALREKLEKLPPEEILKLLKEVDSDSAKSIDPQNVRRLIRALEVSMLSSEPFSKQKIKSKPDFKTLIIGIDIPRETLYAKIDARVDQMIKKGLVEEVRLLLKKYPSDLVSLNTIGYKEIIDYLKNQITLPEAVSRIKFNTHAYVRRQTTWFRRNKDIKWVQTVEQAEKLIKAFLG